MFQGTLELLVIRLEKEKKIINANEQNPESFDELRRRVDQKKISVDKAFHEIQKQIKKAQILASVRNRTSNPSTNNIALINGDFREQSKIITNDSIEFNSSPILHMLQNIFLSIIT